MLVTSIIGTRQAKEGPKKEIQMEKKAPDQRKKRKRTH